MTKSKKAATKFAATKSATAAKPTVQLAKPYVLTSVVLQTPKAVAAAYAPVAPRPKHKVAVTASKKVGANIASKRATSKKATAKKVAKSAFTETPPITEEANVIIYDEALAAVGLTDEDLDSLPDTPVAEATPEASAPQPTQDEPRGQAKKMMALSAVASAAKHHAPAPTKSPVTALTKVLDKARFQFMCAEQGPDGVAAYGYAHPDGRAALYTAHQDDINHPETVTAKLETGQTIQVSSNQPDAAKSLWEVLKPVSKKEHRIRQARYDGQVSAAKLRAKIMPAVDGVDADGLLQYITNKETPEQALAAIRAIANQAAADTAAIAAEPVNGVPAHVVRAVEMLGMITGQKFNVSDLRGDKNYSHRLSLLKKLFNRERVLVEETGINNLMQAFYTAIGVGKGTRAAQIAEFTARCKELVTVSRTIKRAVKKATEKALRTVRRTKLPVLTVPGRVLEVSKPLGRKAAREADNATKRMLQVELCDGRQQAQPRPSLKGLVVTDTSGLRILNHKNGTVSLKLERCNSQGAMQVWDTGARLATSVLTPALVKDVKPVMWDANMIETMIDSLLESKSDRTQDVQDNLRVAKIAMRRLIEPARLVPTILPIPAPRAAAAEVTVALSSVQLLEDPLTGTAFVQLERCNSQGAAVVYNNNSAVVLGICPPEWLCKFRPVTVNGRALATNELARAINQLLNPEIPGVAVTPTAARHLTAVLESVEEKTNMAIATTRKFEASKSAATKSTKPAAVKAAKKSTAKKEPTERKSSLFRLANASKAVWSAFATQKGEIIKAFTKLNAVGSKAAGVTRAQLIAALPAVPDKNISFYLSKWQADPAIVEKLAPAE